MPLPPEAASIEGGSADGCSTTWSLNRPPRAVHIQEVRNRNQGHDLAPSRSSARNRPPAGYGFHLQRIRSCARRRSPQSPSSPEAAYTRFANATNVDSATALNGRSIRSDLHSRRSASMRSSGSILNHRPIWSGFHRIGGMTTGYPVEHELDEEFAPVIFRPQPPPSSGATTTRQGYLERGYFRVPQSPPPHEAVSTLAKRGAGPDAAMLPQSPPRLERLSRNTIHTRTAGERSPIGHIHQPPSPPRTAPIQQQPSSNKTTHTGSQIPDGRQRCTPSIAIPEWNSSHTLSPTATGPSVASLNRRSGMERHPPCLFLMRAILPPNPQSPSRKETTPTPGLRASGGRTPHPTIAVPE